MRKMELDRRKRKRRRVGWTENQNEKEFIESSAVIYS